jgi:hypothetical protein
MRRQWNNQTRRYSNLGGRGTTAQRRSTARSRRLLDPEVRIGMVAALVIVGILATQVALSNGVVSEGCRITELEADRVYYQAKIGGLEHRWNSMTSREIIVARAAAELGLTTQQSPPQVIAMVASGEQDSGPSWPQWVRQLGGGTEAQAATSRRSP